MDVHCTTCGEPWDTYHLQFDVIYETGIDNTEAEVWSRSSPHARLADPYRDKFKAIGFEFGSSILNVLRCPACPMGARPDRAALMAAIVEDGRRRHPRRYGETTSKPRTLKIEEDGDRWKGRIKPKIRLCGNWLERAGFKPGSFVSVTHIAEGVLEVRFQRNSELDEPGNPS